MTIAKHYASVAGGNQVLPWNHRKTVSWTHTWEIVAWQSLSG